MYWFNVCQPTSFIVSKKWRSSCWQHRRNAARSSFMLCFLCSRLSQVSRLLTKHPVLNVTGQEVILVIEMVCGRCPVPDTHPPWLGRHLLVSYFSPLNHGSLNMPRSEAEKDVHKLKSCEVLDLKHLFKWIYLMHWEFIVHILQYNIHERTA